MTQSKNNTNKTESGWLLDFVVPLLVLCLAVGWLLYWWWSTRVKEPFQGVETIPDLTGNSNTGSTELINKRTDNNWIEESYLSYKQITANVFGKIVLVNSLFKQDKSSAAIENGYLESKYALLSPALIEKMIITGKAKAKHISNLIGYVNEDEKIGGNQQGYYLLTDNGTETDYYLPGDIYAPMYAVGGTYNMKSLGFEYYLMFHESVIDINNKPSYQNKWTDGNRKGSLDNGIVYFDNFTMVGFITNDNIYKTVDKYYTSFGYVDNMGNFVFFLKNPKPTITSLQDGNSVTVTLNNKIYNYKYFNKDTYLNNRRPNNIIAPDKIVKMITPLLPKETNIVEVQGSEALTGFIQKANVICTDPGASSPANQSLSEAVSYSYTRKIPLGDTYFVKQICISNLITEADKSTDIRIGIKNNRTNTIQFVGFADTPLSKEGVQYLEAITKITGPVLVIQEVKTAYGNEISGDEVIIYSKIATGQGTGAAVMDVCITGYPENEVLDYKTLYTDANQIAGLPPVKKDNVYPQALYTDGEVSQTTQADLPSHITTVELASYSSKSITASSSQLLYKPLVTQLNIPKNGDKVTVLFKNNYSNNTFQVPGPVDHQFIYHQLAPKLFFYKTVIANKFKIYFNKVGVDANTWHASAVSARGYTPTSADINRFKLEFNVTDIRGSINPESVCPSMDKFLSNQLDSEVILDAMEYNDRINTEQAKLIGQKDNLLTLMEQEEDITRLNRVINRLLDIEKQRSNETNTLNAVKFTNQMKEAMKLKEVLEDRIAQRKKNTLNLQFRVNQVVETDELPAPTLAPPATREPFEDIPVPTNATNQLRPTLEDNLRIR